MGFDKRAHLENLERAVERVRRLALKPPQKTTLLFAIYNASLRDHHDNRFSEWKPDENIRQKPEEQSEEDFAITSACN